MTVSSKPKSKNKVSKIAFTFSNNTFLLFFYTIVSIILWFSIPLIWPNVEGLDSQAATSIRYMALAIYALLVWGLAKGHTHLLILSREQTVVSQVKSRTEGMSSDYDENTIAPHSFKDLELAIPFPDNLTESVCRKMLKRILRDAADYIYDQREAVVRPYKEELNDRLQVIKTLQATALRLGILGTFIGLIMAIFELGDMPDFFSDGLAQASSGVGGSTEEIRRNMFIKFSEQLFNALHISFGTSVVGLEVSILLAFYSMFLKYRQNRLFLSMDEIAGKMMSLARRATYKEKGLLSSFAQMKSGMDDLKLKIHDENQATLRGVNEFGERIVEQTVVIEKGLKMLSSVREKWVTFLGALRMQQEELFAESLRLRKESENSFNEFSKTIENQQNEFIKYTVGKVEMSKENFEGFLHNLEERQKVFLKDFSEVFDQLSIKRLGKDIRDSVSLTGEKLENSIGKNMESITSNLLNAGNDLKAALIQNIIGLGQQLESVEGSQEKLNSIMNSATEKIDGLTREISNTDKHSAILERIKSNLEATINRVESAQKSFQTEIQESVERLHSVPLDDRIADKIACAADKALFPVNENLNRVSSEFKTLQTATSIITKAAQNLNNLFRRSTFKIYYRVVAYIGIAAGLSLISVAVLGILVLIDMY